MQLKDIVPQKIISVDSGSAITEAVKIMNKEKIGSILVKEQDRIVGIFTERDLLSRVDLGGSKPPDSVKVKDVMTKKIRTVDYNGFLEDAIGLMNKYEVRHMPVVKDGEIIGMVSLRDVLVKHEEYLEYMLGLKTAELNDKIRKLGESEERFRTIFNNSAAGIMFADKHEHIIACNLFAANILGFKEKELYGRHVKSLYPLKEWQRIRSQNIRRLGIHRYLETKMVQKGGRQIDVEVSLSVLKDADGKVAGSIGIFRDITDRKKIEEWRREFIGVVSHELLNPLLPISEGVSQVLDGIFGPVTEQQRKFLGIVLDETGRIKRIVRNLVDLFKFEIGKIPIEREYADILNLVDSVISTFQPQAESKGLELKTILPDVSVKAYIDKDRIVQVFTNLIVNAIKFTDQGHIEVEVCDEASGITCSVSDTGQGIAKEELSRIFEKFQQAGDSERIKNAGIGLGLSVCKDIVELHGGKIWAESKIDKGAKFIFTLPKYSVSELFEQHVIDAVNMSDKTTVFSILVIELKNFDILKKKLNSEQLTSIIGIIYESAKSNLRYPKDLIFKDISKVLVLLPQTSKDDSLGLIRRLKRILYDHLTEKGDFRDIDINFMVSSYPAGGRTKVELFNNLEQI